MGLYNNDDVDHLCSVQRGYKSCCISGQFILNDEEFRTMVFKTGILPTVSEGKQDKTGARRLKAQN